MNNPLSVYRRTQRELRVHFDAFTRENCETCPTPCCRQPARILPTDIMLAESAGWKDSVRSSGLKSPADMVSEIAGRVATSLHDPPDSAEAPPESLPCEYLAEGGCTFPADLRPFGCTTYVCSYMHEQLARPALAKIKRLVRQVEVQHRILMRALHTTGRAKEGDHEKG